MNPTSDISFLASSLRFTQLRLLKNSSFGKAFLLIDKMILLGDKCRKYPSFVVQNNFMLRFGAQLVSIVFHPLLMVTYMLVLLLLVNPYLFGYNHIASGDLLIIRVFFSTVVIPGLAVLMMKFLGLIQSLEMREREERIGPLIVTGMFYIWMFYNFYKNPELPEAFTIFMLGATLGLFVAFLINLFLKISLHAVGMGGLLGMVVITMLLYSYDSFPLLDMNVHMVSLFMSVILACGLVGTARLILDAHKAVELYAGYIIGFSMQFIAFALLFG